MRNSRIRSILHSVDDLSPIELTHSNPFLHEKWLSQLEIRPVTAVHWQNPPGWKLDCRINNADDMWFMVAQGRFECTERDGQHHTLCQGDLYLCPRDLPHSIRSLGDRDELIAVHFHATVHGTLPLLRILPLRTIHRALPKGHEVNSELCREHHHQAPGCSAKMTSLILDLLVSMLREGGVETGYPSNDRLQLDPELFIRLEPALHIIEKEMHRSDLRIAEVAQSIRVSEVYLRKLFKRCFQCSPITYLQKRRIEKACQLLKDSDLKVEAIASLCGFSDAPFFYRLFKKHTGATPRRYLETMEV